MLAIHLSPRRSGEAAAITMRKAVEAAQKHPKEIITDMLGSYIKPIRRTMPHTMHLKSEGLDAELHNNLSERLQGTLRDRDKVLRGLKSREAGQTYLEGIAVDYNLFRPHMALKDSTPAAIAGVNIGLRNWGDVVEKLTYATKPTRPKWQTSERVRPEKPSRRQRIEDAVEALRRRTRRRARYCHR